MKDLRFKTLLCPICNNDLITSHVEIAPSYDTIVKICITCDIRIILIISEKNTPVKISTP